VKIKIFAWFIVLFLPVVIFGLDTNTYPERMEDINRIIQSRAFFNAETNQILQTQTFDLSYSVKKELIRKYQPILPVMFFLNLLLPSFGSWYGGDTKGGVLIVSMFGVGAGSIIGGAILMGPLGGRNETSAILLLGGIGCIAVGEIVNLIIPFTYNGYYIDQLKKGLDFHGFTERPSAEAPVYISLIPAPHDQLIELEVVRFRF
jgi:hypothetical protein